MKGRMRVSLATLLLPIALVATGAGLRSESRPTGTALNPAETPGRPSRIEASWEGAMARLTSAIEREDRASLLYAWRAAYAVGIATQTWQPMIALGDAAQRIAVLDRQREPFEREARGAYLLALRAARRARSNDGLIATADGFERLGDAEMATQVRRLAARLRADVSAR